MCKPDDISSAKEATMTPTTNDQINENNNNDDNNNNDANNADPIPMRRKRRGQRDRQGVFVPSAQTTTTTTFVPSTRKTKQSKSLQRHGKDAPSGGMEALIPSLIGITILVCSVMAQQGFRGRASVAGIDLGTTNSVICVQAPSKSVGTIDCIPDPATNSPVIPSVVSFLEPSERKVGPSSKIKSELVPHPSHVVVGDKAKSRIDTHPYHTLYHAKRVVGVLSSDEAVSNFAQEVEFNVQVDNENEEATFHVDDMSITPKQVGSYVVHHLVQITKEFLGHDNVKSAVVAVPAKFDTLQRQRTMEAFIQAGIKVARVLEEPTAAALAYGLHKKEGVDKILVYDFGGGTLDVSILHVSDGFCEVMGCDGDNQLGGADFDAAIAHYLADKHGDILTNLQQSQVDLEALVESCPRVASSASPSSITSVAGVSNGSSDTRLPLCSISSFHTIGEKLKIELSTSSSSSANDMPAETIAQAQCLGFTSPITDNNNDIICNNLEPISLVLTLQDYDIAVQHLYQRAIVPITRLLEELTLEPSEIDEIVMVGGTTRMPQIRQLVRNAFDNAELNVHIDPDLTVAYGAASVID